MNRNEIKIEKLLRQFDDAVFADDCGMENAMLYEETMRLYEEADSILR